MNVGFKELMLHQKKPLKGKNDSIEINIGCFPGINMKWLSPPPPKDEVSIAGGVRP